MRLVLLAGAAGALLLGGCGGGPDSAAAPPVRVQVTAPGDRQSVRSAVITVRGTVRPAGATVTVRGQRAQVAGPRFSARVNLQPGVNVIDVLASDGSARPALTALRVRRITTVRVPDVAGLSVDDARTQIEGDGLQADVRSTDSLFDRLLGGELVVCQSDPPAGDAVPIGSTVHVFVSRAC